MGGSAPNKIGLNENETQFQGRGRTRHFTTTRNDLINIEGKRAAGFEDGV